MTTLSILLILGTIALIFLAVIIRSRLTTLAKSSPIGRQIEANVALETRLPRDAAEELVAGLLTERNDPERLRVKYVEICDKHVLRGPHIGGATPSRTGPGGCATEIVRALS